MPRNGLPVASSIAGRLRAVVGVEHAGGADDAQAEIALHPHHLAHGQLRDVAHAGDLLALLLGRLDPQVVEAADLGERVQLHQPLADASGR